MAIKAYKPTTPGRRGMTVTDYSGLSKNGPEKSLCVTLKKKSGRNNYGRITVRHHGGGTRPKYRIIDFKRNKDGMNATVMTLEYDPNRSAFIALVQYEDGEKRYILAPHGLKVGDTVRSGEDCDIKPGNALPLTAIPVGTFIHKMDRCAADLNSAFQYSFMDFQPIKPITAEGRDQGRMYVDDPIGKRIRHRLGKDHKETRQYDCLYSSFQEQIPERGIIAFCAVKTDRGQVQRFDAVLSCPFQSVCFFSVAYDADEFDLRHFTPVFRVEHGLQVRAAA